MAEVSVIVRTKDRPKLLIHALESIARQTYSSCEVIIVNDGGEDPDISRIEEILGGKFKYCRIDESKGRARAANVGISASTGRYVAFLDDDDEFYPDHLEVLVRCLNETDFRGAYTGCRHVLKSYDPDKGEFVVKRVITEFGRDFSFPLLLFENYIPLISVLLDRKTLEEIGGFDEELEVFEDWDMLIRFSRRTPLVYVPKVTCQYNAWSRNTQKAAFGGFDHRDVYLKVIRKHRDLFTPEFITFWQFHEKKVLEQHYGELLNSLNRENHSLRQEVDLLRRDNENLKEWCSNLETARRQLLDELRTVRDSLAGVETDYQRISRELELIQKSFGWRLISGYRALTSRLFPEGTVRGRAYSTALSAVKGLLERTVSAGHKIKSVDKPVGSGRSVNQELSVCFIVNHLDGGQRYRGYHMSEYLGIAGIKASVIPDNELPARADEVFRHSVVVLYRLFYSPLIDDIVKTCKKNDITVVYDIDDYIFDDEALPYLNVRGVSKDELRQVIRNHRKAMDLCDICLVPTEALSRLVSATGKKAYVIRNALSSEVINISENAYALKETNNSRIYIGYFSGTTTHDQDFLVASEALLAILEHHPDVDLLIGGHLKLDARFDRWIEKRRVRFLPYVHWRYLPYNIARADINIVPLVQNVFNDAKSELKYFEAALLRIPTVASPTESYRFAIRSGENGFLADGTEEWVKYLELLVTNPDLRKNIGEKAYFHTMNTYSPKAMAPRVAGVFREIAG
ncbi:glycosyltransferase [Thermodesulforhabdus norvegica]|uniref:Glycosyltransferase, GT2 family n=1 Tax=Thermodesulforhabdus norvegica TaxID=39841 RepID=A0A1I4SJM1_9BACT|nr:glycosyltransferase [Thermodesulforhabdus norvegica]SFM64642.1 Glycosyltransferase, GT2 family [Thermodesulforhabdus norvegica]